MINCPKCSTGLQEETRFCPRCGCDIAKEYLIEPVCPKCEKQFPDGTKFCDVDGSQLTTKEKLIPRCVKCGKDYPKGVRYCPNDGGEVIPEAFRQNLFGIDSAAFEVGKRFDAEAINNLISSEYDVKIKSYFSRGWDLFRSNMGLFIGFTVVLFLIHTILAFIPIVGPITSWLISTPLMAGFYFGGFSLMRNEQIEFKVFFRGFSLFLPLFLAGLVTSIFIVIGYVLLVIPGIYLMVAYVFTIPLVADKKMEFWQAMETSRKLITKKWFSFFLFCLCIVLLNIVGTLALLVGLLFTVPMTFCIIAAAYDDIIGIGDRYGVV
ncbi:MAG: hypothetical protein SNJ53_05400 [Thermodesulfovibrionales bacterium]